MGADQKDLEAAVRRHQWISVLEKFRLLRRSLVQSDPTVARKLQSVEQAVNCLKPEYRQLLRMLYIEAPVDKLWIMDQMHISESTYYRWKRSAINDFLTAVRGM